jgi:lysophospholipase L1-like esterase
MTSPLRRLDSRLPWALACALLAALLLTLGTWLYVRSEFVSAKRQLLFVGDSTVANVRLAPGERFEDWANGILGDDWRAQNFAHSGAGVGDFFLQYQKARVLGVEPDLVVLGFQPSKLVPRSEHRFMSNGSNLAWLPFDRYGYEMYLSLSSARKNIAITGKLGLLFGFTDAITAWWYERVTAPDGRSGFLSANAKKHHSRVVANAQLEGKRWTNSVHLGSYAELAAGDSARDLALFARYLREHEQPAVVILLPQANPALIKKTFSPAAQEKLSKAHEITRQFCLDQGLALIDFNEDESFKTFRAPEWDDLFHLKSPAAYQRMTKTLSAWVRTHLGEESRAKHHASLL